MFSGGTVTGPALIGILILAIVVLLVLIIKFQLNAFVALLVTAFGTGILVNMPLPDVASTVTEGFGDTLGSIGMVTGLGVMLGKFMFESGGIESIANKILGICGEKKSPVAVAVSGFITGIPVFGDVVYIMFAPMLRVLSKKTGISMVNFACAISVATTCTFALVLPTAPPLAVAGELDIEIGIFFFYALISAFVGMVFGGIIYGSFLNRQDHKNNHFYTFDDLEEEERAMNESAAKSQKRMGAGKALSILLVPIILILLGSFVPLALGEDAAISPFVTFIGDKNFAMMVGVIYAALISRKYLVSSITDIMTEAADQVGLMLLITGAGGAFAAVITASGVNEAIESMVSNISGNVVIVLLLAYILGLLFRQITGSGTVASLTTFSIIQSVAAVTPIHPVFIALACLSGAMFGATVNDSGFWIVTNMCGFKFSGGVKTYMLGEAIASVVGIILIIIVGLISTLIL